MLFGRMILWIVLLTFCFQPILGYSRNNDDYLEGYITALVQEVHQAPSVRIRVKNGVVHLKKLPADQEKREKIIQAVTRTKGVQRVEISEVYIKPMRITPQPDQQPEPRVQKEPPIEAHPKELEELEIKDDQKTIDEMFTGFSPKNDLFEPLLADPWESRFFMSYRYDLEMDRNTGVVGLGEVFGIYRLEDIFGKDHHLQVNVEGAVFSYFDLDTESTDLLNNDFQFGLPIVYRYNNYSTRFRVMHRSSHLGDDFIRQDPAIFWTIFDRQVDNNLVDLVQSYEQDWWRVYAGGVYRFTTRPKRDPWDILYGLEIIPWNDRAIHPIFGVQYKQQGEFGWSLDQRYVAGIEISGCPSRDRSTKILAEYYNGQRLGWPFFQQDGDYVGVGLYFEL